MIAVFYSCCAVVNGQSDYIFSYDPSKGIYAYNGSAYNTHTSASIVTNGARYAQSGDTTKGIPSIQNANFYAYYGS